MVAIVKAKDLEERLSQGPSQRHLYGLVTIIIVWRI